VLGCLFSSVSRWNDFACLTATIMGDDGGSGHWLVWMEWRPAGWLVSASVNLPLHHEVQRFSSDTGSSGWPRKKAHKMVVVWVVGVTATIKAHSHHQTEPSLSVLNSCILLQLYTLPQLDMFRGRSVHFSVVADPCLLPNDLNFLGNLTAK